MLKIIELTNPKLKKNLFQNEIFCAVPDSKNSINAGNNTSSSNQVKSWIVSDLYNKFELQKIMLDRLGFYEDDYVLRIHEFWLKLLKIYFPQVQIWTKDILQVWVSEQIQELNLDLGANLTTVVLDLFDQLHGVFYQQNSEALLKNWFEEQPDAFQKWGAWYNISKVLFSRLQSQEVLLSKWVPSFLLQKLGSEVSFFAQKVKPNDADLINRGYVFDIGPDLSKTEAELIHWLSRSENIGEVIVIQPDQQLKIKFPFCFEGYDYLVSVCDKHQVINKNLNSTGPVNDFANNADSIINTNEKNIKLKQSGILAEVEDVTTRILEWIKQGIELKSIAIVSNQIEMYWPYLSIFFKKNNITYNKEKVSRFHSYPWVMQWVSRVKLLNESVQFSDLELGALSLNLFDQIRFEDFFGLYSESLLSEDLKRWDYFYNLIDKFKKSNKKISQKLNRDDFVGILLTQLQPENLDAENFKLINIMLEKIFKDLLSPVYAGTNWKLSDWILIFESLIFKLEIKLVSADPDGVALLNLSSADSLGFKKIYFLGLTETQFQQPSSQLISAKDSLRLKTDLGLLVGEFEKNSSEFLLNWIQNNDDIDKIFSYPVTGFAGEIQSPLPFWLHQNPAGEVELTVSKISPWSAIRQTQEFSELKSINSVEVPFSEFAGSNKIKLSASSIERYLNCGFQYFAEKVLKLKDPAVIDMDPDRRNLGSLSHLYLEKITEKFDDLVKIIDQDELIKNNLNQILENIRKEISFIIVDEQVWLGIKKKLVATGIRFIHYEINWFKKFPLSKIQHTEMPFKVEKENYILQGKIDRVDTDKNNSAVIIDYKSSVASFKGFNYWIENRQLQLLIYSLVLESNDITVAGAFLYDFQRLNRDKGFKVIEIGNQFFSFDDKKKNKISLTEKKDLLNQTQAVIDQTVDKIKSGNYDPIPADKELCKDCQWRDLCRAPHLNLI